jgi:MFS family permease
MNWTFLLVGFALAVFMGSALVSLLVTVRPDWSSRRRRLTAASVLPAITAIGTLLITLLVVERADNENMRDLALAAVLTVGGEFTLLAWVGGLIGATLTSRRRDA